MMTQKYQSPLIWSAVISSSLCFMTQIHACDGIIFELHLGNWLHASHVHKHDVLPVWTNGCDCSRQRQKVASKHDTFYENGWPNTHCQMQPYCYNIKRYLLLLHRTCQLYLAINLYHVSPPTISRASDIFHKSKRWEDVSLVMDVQSSLVFER